VPTYLCPRRSASSDAWSRMRWHSSLIGRSTEVGIFSPKVVCFSICLRIVSAVAGELASSLADRALLYRKRPSSTCSDSI